MHPSEKSLPRFSSPDALAISSVTLVDVRIVVVLMYFIDEVELIFLRGKSSSLIG
jgi:hypothetical protein